MLHTLVVKGPAARENDDNIDVSKVAQCGVENNKMMSVARHIMM